MYQNKIFYPTFINLQVISQQDPNLKTKKKKEKGETHLICEKQFVFR